MDGRNHRRLGPWSRDLGCSAVPPWKRVPDALLTPAEERAGSRHPGQRSLRTPAGLGSTAPGCRRCAGHPLLQGSTLPDAASTNRAPDALLSRPMTEALSPGHKRDRPPDRKTEVPKPHAN